MSEHLKRLFTRDEYYAMAKAGILKQEERVELIEGVIYRMHPAGNRQAGCVTLLNDLLAVLAAQGEVSISPQNPVHLNDFSEPRADLAVVQRRQAGLSTANPTSDEVYFLIEVSDSSLAHDQQSKIPLYARCGILEVWLVDLTKQVLEVHRDPAPAGYRKVQRFRRGGRVAPLTFPDFEIAVESILP